MSEITNYKPKDTSCDNFFFNYANETMAESFTEYEKGNVVDSWLLTIPARLSYLADAVASLIALPLYLIATLFTLPSSLITRDWRLWKENLQAITEKVHHFTYGIVGGIIAPTLAYRGRNSDKNGHIWLILFITVAIRRVFSR